MYSLSCIEWSSLVYCHLTSVCSPYRLLKTEHLHGGTHTDTIHSTFLYLLHTPHLHLVHPAHPRLPPLHLHPQGSCLQLPLSRWGSETAPRRLHCQTPPTPVVWAACCAQAGRRVSGTVWSAPRWDCAGPPASGSSWHKAVFLLGGAAGCRPGGSLTAGLGGLQSVYGPAHLGGLGEREWQFNLASWNIYGCYRNWHLKLWRKYLY